MLTLNKVQLIGALGVNPEVSKSGSGKLVCKLSVATSYMEKKVMWHRVIVWEKLADLCNKNLKKGNRVYVEGYLNYRDVERDCQLCGEKGITAKVTEIVATNVIFLDKQPVNKKEEREAYDDHDMEVNPELF